MSSRRSTGDGGRGRPRKKVKCETLSSDDEEWEQPPPSSSGDSDLLIYDYVPNTDMGDVVVGE